MGQPIASRPTLNLIRGLPGSGKSTLARALAGETARVVSADDFFYQRGAGVYAFDPSLLKQAHEDCQSRTKDLLGAGGTVFVANTFSKQWEVEPYARIAQELGVELVIYEITCETSDDVETCMERGLHGVPRAAYQAMLDRWECFETIKIPLQR